MLSTPHISFRAKAAFVRFSLRPWFLKQRTRSASLLGLLGTVLGLEDAFDRVVVVGMGKPEQLAAGINQALITTIAGLWLAIPLMLIAGFLNARVRLMMRLIDQRLMPVVDAIVAERRRPDAA